MRYTLEEIEKLAGEYLETLDDKDRDEYWMSDDRVQSIGIHGFIEWLQKREGVQNES